jgi:hypothetical protein
MEGSGECMNKQPWTSDKGRSACLGVGRGALHVAVKNKHDTNLGRIF